MTKKRKDIYIYSETNGSSNLWKFRKNDFSWKIKGKNNSDRSIMLKMFYGNIGEEGKKYMSFIGKSKSSIIYIYDFCY